MLLVQPYKSEILPHWRFKTLEIVKVSATKIYSLFENYLKNGDFVGADMARKFLQMGFTRSRRYANHSSERKYSKPVDNEDQKIQKEETQNLEYPYSSGSSSKNNPILEQEKDWQNNEKAKAAEIFKNFWFEAKDNLVYKQQKLAHQRKYGK